MNTNQINTEGFSNPDSEWLYLDKWPDEPEIAEQYEEGGQCGGCSFFAPFNADWGLCCNRDSRHHLETVFEHFSCACLAREGWGAHSFTSSEGYFCRCGSYTSLAENTELVSLRVQVQELADENYRAELVMNPRITAEETGIYFALESIREQVKQVLTNQPGNDG